MADEPWVSWLAYFLEILLDTSDGAARAETYFGLGLITDGCPETGLAFEKVEATCMIRLLAALLDLGIFEARAIVGTEKRFRTLRPAPRILRARLRAIASALVAVEAVATRTGAAFRPLTPGTGSFTGGAEWEFLERLVREWAALDDETKHLLEFAMVPMSTTHDEYAFIRVIQASELLFLPIVTRLAATRDALRAQEDARALEAARPLAALMQFATKCLGILATVSAESFASFRPLLEGQGGIESRRYRLIEAICSRPSSQRLASLAFAFLPVSEIPTDTVEAAVSDSGSAPRIEEIVHALTAFDDSFIGWKAAHYRITARIVADLAGTGGTEGASYLRENLQTSLMPALRDRLSLLSNDDDESAIAQFEV
jgi:tryptophan 2,3-dioxygenase